MSDGAGDGSLAALLCALSFATSLALGDRMEHGLRSAYIALRLAESLGLRDEDREAAFYGALLKDAGCTACGAGLAAFFPDQPVPNLDLMLRDRSGMQTLLAFLTKYVPLDAQFPSRVTKAMSFVMQCRPVLRESVKGHCEVAELFARRLGFGEHVQRAVRFQWERWDGAGVAYGLKGDDVPPAARVLHLAQMVEFAYGVGGLAAAEALAREHAGVRFEPGAVAAFLALSERGDFSAVLDKEDVQETVLAMKPTTAADRIGGDQRDAVCEALADLIDAKTPRTRDHSRTVASIAQDIGRISGLAPRDQARLRQAALVHDLGSVALPMGILERKDRLSPSEWEQFRLHPYYTQRVLERVVALRDLAPDAAAHHEQLDGNGYHRQLAAEQIPLTSRILAVADRYAEVRRHGGEPEQALDELRPAVGKELDPSCYNALVQSLGVDGRARSEARQPTAAHGLSEREVDVLRLLARGMSNPQIAESLVISRRTVEHHVEHIFNKLGVTCRTAAVAYAAHSRLA